MQHVSLFFLYLSLSVYLLTPVCNNSQMSLILLATKRRQEWLKGEEIRVQVGSVGALIPMLPIPFCLYDSIDWPHHGRGVTLTESIAWRPAR